ncbi:IPT/TIG domain-containing protein, partial [Verrucomicrobiota bacterium]
MNKTKTLLVILLTTLLCGFNEATAGTIFGDAPDAWTESIELSSIDGSNGFILAGEAAGDMSGVCVKSAGDVNGDGFQDILVGAMKADPNGRIDAGSSYVVFGKSGGFTETNLLSNLDGTNGFRLEGETAGDVFGDSASSAGDVNGDGFDDIIIGAWNADPGGRADAGSSYVVFGKSAGFDATITMDTLGGTNGFILVGEAAGDDSGVRVSGAGDVNGDGFDDIIIGARKADPGGRIDAGSSYVVFGKSGGFSETNFLSNLDGTNGFRFDGAAAGDQCGISVRDAGDVNGDGLDDIIIGAFWADPNGRTDAGSSYVVFGKSDGFDATIGPGDLDGTNGFRIDGATAGDWSGFCVSGAGDMNGDGFDDIIIGALKGNAGAGADTGKSYVVFGKSDGFDSSIGLDTLNGTNGFALWGMEAGAQSGFSVSGAGDVNNDGLDDIIIGARNADPNGRANAGSSYVVFGKTTTGGFAFFTLDNTTFWGVIDGTQGFRLDGVAAADQSGVWVSDLGDVNGDGFDDFIVGARYADPNGRAEAGASYVIFGRGPGSGVQPTIGPGGGGYQVEITGTNLGNGTDITNVTLNGVSVTSIDSQSTTHVTVTAAAAPVGTSGTGDVVVYSTSQGTSTKTDGFTYVKYHQSIDFPAIGNQAATNTVTLSATASSGLPVAFSVASGPASITNETTLSFTGAGTVQIVANQSGDNDWDSAQAVTNTFTVSKVNPDVTSWPTAGAITYGQTLASSTLSDGTASVAGTFSFTTPGTVPDAGTENQGVTFSPTDSARYNTVAGTTSVTVNQKELTV